tara:strand:- start:184 stop:639 length:456 start_codon:yes stop_codon:yes gene_type:complete
MEYYYIGEGKKKKKMFKVICPTCKIERGMRSDAYKKRKSDCCRSCSALNNKQVFKSTHNLDINHPLYRRWTYMKNRVINPEKRKSYLDKNIKVCDEWKHYENFYHWSLNNGFKKELELDRIDNDKGYSPENCQWITHKENVLKIPHLFGRL